MVRYETGNIFESPAQVITNPINCVGVMGSGLALEFKNRFQGLFKDYERRCLAHRVKPGEPYLYEDDEIQVLNFPTKRHWKDSSRLEDIEAGLKMLSENFDRMGIFYLALPALGCGLGGLEWSAVKPLIDKYLGEIPELEVVVYEPTDSKSQKVKGFDGSSREANKASKVAASP